MMKAEELGDFAHCILPGAQEPQLLIDTNWGEEWRRIQRVRKHVDSSEKWDKRAPSFGSVRGESPYVTQFIESLNLQAGETVFDMGCGNGAIAVPLAQAGFEVTARDFSAGMLAALAAGAEEAGVLDRIHAAQMSWEDDWEAAGLKPHSFDVAFASRSVITQDLAAALAKLSWISRNRCCVTTSTGYTPKLSPTILRELGITSVAAYDFIYTFNILVQQGHCPEMHYIVHDRSFHFDSLEEVREEFLGLLEHASTYCDADELARAHERLDDWIEGRMEPNEKVGQVNHHGEVEGAYKIVMPNDIRWACITWEV